MKKVMILAVAVVGFSGVANASMKYECSRYVHGDEVESKAWFFSEEKGRGYE